ncbi:MAG: glycine zipper family protein [Flavipsychrobacter sp.]|nr:glycine zipper family protein [Flavipsychrobacter sp.]
MTNKILLFIATAVIMASCNNSAEQQAAAQARQVDSMKNEMAKKQIIDSMNAAQAAQAATVNNERPVVHSSTVHHSSTVNRPNGTATTTETNYSTTNAATAPVKKQRKGIGPVAAGAIIGAGAGAITGAMVDKKKGEGAVVGGILGAGAGAGAGAIIKKHQKNKDEE